MSVFLRRYDFFNFQEYLKIFSIQLDLFPFFIYFYAAQRRRLNLFLSTQHSFSSCFHPILQLQSWLFPAYTATTMLVVLEATLQIKMFEWETLKQLVSTFLRNLI